jgi:hypothetical protein
MCRRHGRARCPRVCAPENTPGLRVPRRFMRMAIARSGQELELRNLHDL